jgi:hypothetical protein
MENVKNKSNIELAKIQKDLGEEYELIRNQLLQKYDYWLSIEKKYNEVVLELNNRFGINNK